MKFLKKALAATLGLLMIGGAMAAAAEVPDNVVHSQTVISREFLESLFDKPWQDEAGAVVSYDNLDVAKNGSNNQQMLFAGVRKETDEGPINSVADENQKEGQITYKLAINKETRELAVTMVYRSNIAEDKIRVYVSESESFGSTPAMEFSGEADTYNHETKRAAINENGKEAVYVKIVLPYGRLNEDGWIDTGINRLVIAPAVTDALHTVDVNGKNDGATVLFDELTKADSADYDPWGNGLYDVSKTDEQNHIYPPAFKSDTTGHPFVADQTHSCQWG